MDKQPSEQTGAKTSIYRHMLRGSSWAVALTWTLRGIGLINTVILARLLAPEDFGLVTMASLAFGFLGAFVNLGTGTLLIRQPEASREHCDTAWTISLLRGMLVAVTLVVTAPLIAAYFREERVIPLVYIVAFNSVLLGALNVGLVLMRKELDFAREFRYTVLSRLFTFAVTIALAFALRSYWALVIGTAVGVVFECWLSYLMHPYRPKLSLARAREYIRFSLALVPLNICSYLTAKVDSFVVGRIAPVSTLGIYNVAADLSTMLTSDLTSQIGRALYASYAKLTDDYTKLRDAYLKSLSALVIVNVAFGLGLFAVSADFVAVVLGPKWSDTVPLIEWLAICGMLRAVMQSMTGGILVVAGRERVAAFLMFVRFAVLAAFSIVGGSFWGVQGVAIGVTLGTAVVIPLGAITLVRLLGFRLTGLLGVVWRPLLAGIVMVVAVRLLHATSLEKPLLTLALDVLTGAVVFLGILVTLWWLSGRPDGAEKMVVDAVASRIR